MRELLISIKIIEHECTKWKIKDHIRGLHSALLLSPARLDPTEQTSRSPFILCNEPFVGILYWLGVRIKNFS